MKIITYKVIASCALFLLLLLFSSVANAQQYYIATNGSDHNKGTSSGEPWATFRRAMTVLRPGDTLFLKDGTYYQSLNVTVSGTQATPVAIKAVNDGQAVVDGQNNRLPFYISGQHYIDVEGIVFKNSSNAVINITGGCSYITMKRVSAYNANYNLNTFPVNAYNSSYITLEDIASGGTGRKPYNFQDCDHLTLRRGWGLWVSHSGVGGEGNYITVYGTDNSIVENCVFTAVSGATGYNGLNVFAHNNYSTTANNNKVYGNIILNSEGAAFGMTSNKYRQGGNDFENNVVIDAPYCSKNYGDATATYKNNTCVNIEKDGFMAVDYAGSLGLADPAYYVSETVKNNAYINISGHGLTRGSNYGHLGPATHSYNKFYNVGTTYSGLTAGTGENTLGSDPYATNYATYGNGAYLMVPSALQGQGESGANVGAEVLYEYVDGSLTSTPLWPWPMEDRIYRETGISVTWESKGGLWKTLNGVYK